MYKVCIVGGGSIGGIIAYLLYRGGVRDLVVYYGSRRSVKEIEKYGGIEVKLSNGSTYFVPLKPRYYRELLGYCDIVLNAVKAVDFMETIDLMKGIGTGETLYIALQNGFGTYEMLEEIFGPRRSACGVVMIGAYRVKPYLVLEKGIGSIVFGQHMGIDDKLLWIASRIRDGGCITWVTQNIEYYRWVKLAVNAVINPLTAITRAPNNIILTQYGRELAHMILEEVVKAAELKGIKLNINKLYRHVLNIAKATPNNYSSMLQDILRGRKTEIDYINGYIVSILERKNIRSTVNKTLVKIIHLLEETNIYSSKH